MILRLTLALSLSLVFSFVSFFFVVPNVFAQSVLSCTPSRATVNRDLQVGISTNPGDLYVSGRAYLGLDSTQAPLLTNQGGTDLLFQTVTGGDYLFQNRSTTSRLAGIYDNVSGVTAAAPNGHGLVVDGLVQGYTVQGVNQLCLGSGGSPTCINSWSDVNTPAYSEVDTRCDVSGTCANVYATTSVQSSGTITASNNISTATGDVVGNRLCIGTTCYSSWGSAVQGGLAASSGGGTGRGVTRIIAGTGITLTSVPTTGNPAYGEGDVTINASGGTLGCQVIAFTVDTSLPGTTSCPGGYMLTGGLFHREGGGQAGQIICCRVN